MATFTPKLNLEKPLGTEFYNVTGVQNVNSDKIDSFAIDIDNSKFENVGIIIPNGANLNTYRTCGHYRCPEDVSAGTIINAPFGASAFSMIVEGSSGNKQTYHTQTAINHGKTQTKIRATSDDGATWTAWIHVLTEAETVNNLISTSATLPLSAGQGKQLQDTKADKTIQIVAGNGLTGGGDLTASRTLAVASATDGIVVNADNIQLSTIDNLTTVSATKPLSAGQGKILQDSKFNKRTSAGVADLDTMKTDGLFYGYQWTNAPINNNNNIATVDVKVYSPDWIVQSFFDIAQQRYFVRYWYGGTTWSSWVTVLSEKNVINNLISTSTTEPLSAGQGKILDTKNTALGILVDKKLEKGGYIGNAQNLKDEIDTNKMDILLKYGNMGVAIPSGTNLNTFLTKGHYTSVDDAITGSMFNTPFGNMSFTLVVDGIQDNNLYISQLATNYHGTIAQRITLDAGITWTPWTEIINKTTGDATYVKKAGDTMTGILTTTALTTTNGTNETFITARYNNLGTDQVYLYNNSTNIGIYNSMPTHGDVVIFSRSKSTGVVYYAGGNYGTINGSTATFSGNVTAPSITIGGYVVTIV